MSVPVTPVLIMEYARTLLIVLDALVNQVGDTCIYIIKVSIYDFVLIKERNFRLLTYFEYVVRSELLHRNPFPCA